jgi:hypothetical protein
MKKKIASIIFIGVTALISMGFQTASPGNDNSGFTGVKIIKGEVINSDGDNSWDLVTFGLQGFAPGRDALAFVEILDKKGGVVGQVFDLSGVDMKGTTWYEVDLQNLRVPKEFTLEVHLVTRKWWDINSISVQANNGSAGAIPIDPEETILIVKYP